MLKMFMPHDITRMMTLSYYFGVSYHPALNLRGCTPSTQFKYEDKLM